MLLLKKDLSCNHVHTVRPAFAKATGVDAGGGLQMQRFQTAGVVAFRRMR